MSPQSHHNIMNATYLQWKCNDTASSNGHSQ